jgi:hypothetical protein
MTKYLILFSIFASFNICAVETFKAEYKVFKAGKEIGLSTIELLQDGDSYLLKDETDGTYGMASFLGFKRSETTVFYNIDGQMIPQSYQMMQKVAFNKRASNYQINFDSNSISGTHKGTVWKTNNFNQAYSTPNLVKINLALDICSGKTDNLNYDVLDAGKIKQYNFIIENELDGIIEVHKIHTTATRITKTWLNTKQNCLPVKTYHIEDGEDPIETQLIDS